MSEKCIPVFQEAGFWLAMTTQCWKMLENTNRCLCFLKTKQRENVWDCVRSEKQSGGTCRFDFVNSADISPIFHTSMISRHGSSAFNINGPLCWEPTVRRSWWCNQMGTFSALLAICAGNSPVPSEFPAQRPVTRSFDVFFDLRLNKQFSKHSWGWWFETLSRPSWRHRNGESLHKGSVMQIFSDFFAVILNKQWNTWVCCDLRHHDAQVISL